VEEYTLVNSDMSNINNALKKLLSGITSLRNNKLKRYMFGKLYNWENQTNHLIKLW
jgi:hypothetical protein